MSGITWSTDCSGIPFSTQVQRQRDAAGQLLATALPLADFMSQVSLKLSPKRVLCYAAGRRSKFGRMGECEDSYAPQPGVLSGRKRCAG